MSRSLHQRGRKRPICRIRADGRYYGYGPEEYDARSGWLFPRQFMQPNYGRLVSSFQRDNSFDLSHNSRIDTAASGRNAVPTISCMATVATASETGPVSGIFTLQRIGDTSTAFDVTISLTGTARVGAHYVAVPLTISFAVGDVLKQVVIVPVVGGLGAVTSATVILTAVPDGSSSWYAAYTATAIGPLSSTDYTIVMLNSATVVLTH